MNQEEQSLSDDENALWGTPEEGTNSTGGEKEVALTDEARSLALCESNFHGELEARCSKASETSVSEHSWASLNEKSLVNLKNSGRRWKEVTQKDIEDVQLATVSKHTKSQTEWGVKVFRHE